MIRRSTPRAGRPSSRLVENLEARRLLTIVNVAIDDGSAGYADGQAAGASLYASANNDITPAAVRDSAGNLHAVFDSGGRALYSFKGKFDSAWTAPVDLGVSSISEPRIAVDTAGGKHVVFTIANKVWYTYQASGGSTWSAPVMLSLSGGSSSIKQSIAADGAGNVHLTFEDNVSGNYDIRYRKWSGGVWGAEEIVANNSLAETTPRIAAGTDGRASVVWCVDGSANKEIQHRQRNAAGTWGAVERLDNTTTRSLDPDVAMGTDNAVHVTWHDNVGNANWDIAYVKNAGGGWSVPTYMSSPGTVDAISSVSVGPDNKPRVSWMDYNNLYLAKFDGANWSRGIVMAQLAPRQNALAVDGLNRTYVLAQVQKAGVTNGGTYDLWGYADAGMVVGRSLFYNQSAFDGNNAAANASDDSAIAPDKSALLPGGTAAFANYSSYDKGINGVMIDVVGIPSSVSTLLTSDFTFRAGNDANDPSTWAAAPDPSSITIRRGAGVGGSDRVTLTWPNYNPAAPNPAVQAVAKRWLGVTLKNDANTGTAAPDTFYFGNAVGESGDNGVNAQVTFADVGTARDNFKPGVPVTNRWDYNRDGAVNLQDVNIANSNQTNAASALQLIHPPAIAPSGGASAWSTISGTGYQNDYRVAAAGDGSKYATWQFDASGDIYDVQLTWEPSPSNGSNVPVYITTGSNGTASVFFVNMQVAPVGSTYNGRVFQTITSMSPAGGVQVMVDNVAGGAVVADAARVVGGSNTPERVFTGGGYDLSPDIVADPQGGLHAVYHSGADTNVWFVKYSYKPYGGTWTTPVQIGGTGTAGSAKIARGPDGTLHVVFHTGKQIFYVQKPLGGSWSSQIQIPGQLAHGFEPDIAVDSNNVAHVVWHEEQSGGADFYIKYANRSTSGVWSTPIQVQTGTNSDRDVFPAIAVSPVDNSVHVAWQNYEDKKLHYRYRSPAGVWDASEQRLDTMSKNSNAPDLVVDANNVVHVVWMENRTDVVDHGGSAYDITYSFKTSGTGSWSSPKYFDHNTDPQWVDIDPGIGIQSDGSIAITFSDYNNAYIVRKPALTGVWSAIRTIYQDGGGDNDQGAKANVLCINPFDDSINVMFMSNTGTSDGSWDIWYYNEI